MSENDVEQMRGPKNPESSQSEQEGEGWNQSLEGAGKPIIKRAFSNLMDVSRERRQEIENFLKKVGGQIGEGAKEFGKTLTPKDLREAVFLLARAGSEVNPLIGVGMGVVATGTAIIKERSTWLKVKTEKEEGKSTLRKYFEQTALGKLLAKDSPSGLSRKARGTAVAVGAGASRYSKCNKQSYRQISWNSFCKRRRFFSFLPLLLSIYYPKSN